MPPVINAAIIKANSKARRFVVSFFLGTLSFGWLSIFSSLLVQHPQSNTPVSSSILGIISHGLLLSTMLMGLGLLAFAIWMGQRGTQSLRQGCYPPTKAIVVCDTLLVTGWRATVKAISAIMLAIISFLGALTLSFEILGFLNL